MYLYKYHLVQLTGVGSNSIRTRKIFKSEHLYFPGKELKTHNRMEINL